MSRTSARALHEDAVGALEEALAHHGCHLDQDKYGLALHFNGEHRPVELVALSYATPSSVAQLVRDRDSDQVLRVLVADAIPAQAKELLQDAGWAYLDRRGHLFVKTQGLHLNDFTMRIERVKEHQSTAPIRGRAGISAAALLLMSPDDPPGIREIARQIGMSPSTVSAAMSHIRDASLVTGDKRPLVPELFWELADAWEPRRHPLQELPDPGDQFVAQRLSYGLDPIHEQGWVISGTVGALELGAPLVATADFPPDFYVPSPAALREATNRFGEVRWEHRACTAAVAPSPVVTDGSRLHGRTHGRWPIAHPLFVALDLAQDRARGVEILRDWSPPDPFSRVW